MTRQEIAFSLLGAALLMVAACTPHALPARNIAPPQIIVVSAPDEEPENDGLTHVHPPTDADIVDLPAWMSASVMVCVEADVDGDAPSCMSMNELRAVALAFRRTH